jgi:hypothetical protein
MLHAFTVFLSNEFKLLWLSFLFETEVF